MAVDIVVQSRLLFPFRELALAACARVREHSDHLLDLLDRHQIPASSGVSGLTARFALAFGTLRMGAFACGWAIGGRRFRGIGRVFLVARQLAIDVCDPLVLFADLLFPLCKFSLPFCEFPILFSKILLQFGYRPLIRGSLFAEIVVFLSEPVVLDKQVAEKSQDSLMRPSKQPDNRSFRVLPLLTCLVDIHPPYRSKNEEICPAKSSWGVNCY